MGSINPELKENVRPGSKLGPMPSKTSKQSPDAWAETGLNLEYIYINKGIIDKILI